jgi:hypothetical protein
MALEVSSTVTVTTGTKIYSGTLTEQNDLGLFLDVHAVTIIKGNRRQERTYPVFLLWQRIAEVEIGEGVRVPESTLVREAQILILRRLKAGTRNRQNCIAIIREGLDKGERFTDDRLAELESAERIEKVREKPATYKMLEDGKQWLDANDDEEFSEPISA